MSNTDMEVEQVNVGGNGPSVHDMIKATEDQEADNATTTAIDNTAEDNGDDADETNNFGTNDTRFRDYMRKVRKYGTAAAAGADSLPGLFIDTVRASMDGALDLSADKKLMHKVYEAYLAKREKRVHKEQPKDSVASQVSKLTVAHKVGQIKEFDGEMFMDDVVEVYAARAASEKLKPAFDAYISAGRMALEKAKQKDSPTEDDILNAIRKKEPKSKALADVVQSVSNTLDALITGNRKDGISINQDEDQEIIDAHNALKKWLASYTMNKELDMVRELAIKHGLTVQ